MAKVQLVPSAKAQWVFEKIETYLSKKGLVSTVLSLVDRSPKYEFFNKSVMEIQLAIDEFNLLDPQSVDSVYINARHTQSILKSKLPNYVDVLDQVQDAPDLSESVFSELRDSSYFQDVYKIPNPDHLLINILILIYRTTVLHLNPHLIENRVQISSTIEEMACLLQLSGKPTTLFEATKHWVLDWEEEEFSEELASMIQNH